MQKADPLIRTKLRLPFTRQELVSRPRLQEQIAHGLRGPLTLITAPAGFGKTTLVASGVAGCGMPVAWLSLDKNDNQAGRFLRYLVAALQEADPRIGSEAAQLLAASQQAAPEAVLTSLINDLDSVGEEMVLVLDDYQLISSQAVHDALAFLLEHGPNTFHLVIATRSDPPLPLSRLRARGQTVELRAADLRFTKPEAVQFLNEVMRLQLDAESVEVLEERTEGWITGLQMAALSMRGREDVDRFIREFAGTNRFIIDFMLEEVLARESEEVQAFLLQTAILTRLTGPLCDAVTGGTSGQAMLERLDRRNLFVVPMDDDRRWYRYHHLFADLLQAKLYQSGPDHAARLLSRAAEWCEQEGQIIEAVSYAFAAQDYERAASLIVRYWQPMTNDGEIETVWTWLNALPEDLVRNSVMLSIVYCSVLWLTGQVSAIEAHLVDAERAMGQLNGSAEFDQHYAASAPALAGDYAQMLPVMAAFRSIVARFYEEYETASELAGRALTLMPENLPPQENAQMRGLIFLALATAYDGVGDLERAVSAYAETIRWCRLATNTTGVTGITYRMIGALRLLGRLRAADAACQDALGYIQTQGMARLPAAGILHLAMSEVLLERNELEAAEEHLSQAIALGKMSGRLDTVKNAAYALSRLKQAQHDPTGALAAVQAAEAALVEPPPPLARADLLRLKARILVRQGALSEAERCVEQATQLAGKDRGQAAGNVALAEARVRVALRKPGEAVVQLTQSLTDAEACGRMGAAIELRILRALALVRQGDTREAEADLERALMLGEPEGYVRIFLDEGQPMQLLLAQWLMHASAGTLRDYAIHLLPQFDAQPLGAEGPCAEGSCAGRHTDTTPQEKAPPAGGLVEPLTPREMEVLKLMGAGYSNRQIAENLVLSEGTIKFHVHSILEKLSVHSRTAALARAKDLRLT